MKKQSDVMIWSKEMFSSMRGENNQKLDSSDMKGVRELALRRFGYMMFVFNEVADAYKEVNI